MRIGSSRIWPEMHVGDLCITTFTCISFLGFTFRLSYWIVNLVFLHAFLAKLPSPVLLPVLSCLPKIQTHMLQPPVLETASGPVAKCT